MSRQRLRRSRARQRGYTLVELMMALALFTVAMLGIVSLQKITAASNAHAKNVAMAERIAQAWGGQLEMDASAWRGSFGSGFLNSAAIWQRPGYVGTRGFGAAFDALGNPLSDTSTDLAKARFCTHVRMSWLYPPTMGVGGNGMLRAEIRVFWQRNGEAPLDSNTTMCSAAQTAGQAVSIGLSADRYGFVYHTVGVRQHFQI
jgi:prepilin-type N-terminal cleavage/methylation domain-containing protein